MNTSKLNAQTLTANMENANLFPKIFTAIFPKHHQTLANIEENKSK
jgi:hypothetical protein